MTFIERNINLDVEPQLLASVMSKKIATGAKHILIDIPYGPGSKISSIRKAVRVGKKFKQIAKSFNVNLDVAKNATDASDAVKESVTIADEGKIVVANRYVSANMGHQAGKIKDLAERDKFLEWLKDLEFNI